jgi:hypothetical protein
MVKPRIGNLYGMRDNPQISKHTWLEGESFAYTANGSQLRRCMAICPDGKIRVVLAGIPDTYFSIPAHVTINGHYTSGYVTTDSDGEFVYHCNMPA